jgi:hypothetical protein
MMADDKRPATMREHWQAAQGYLQPYEQAGQGANTLYSNALGVGGAAGQSQAMGAYGQGFSPYLSGDMDAATKAIARRAAAQGQSGSGMNALAQQRATREMGTADFNNWLGNLNNLGTRGQAAAGAMAGNEWQYGQAAGGAERAATQGMVGNQTQLGNALASANISPMQALLQGGQRALGAYNAFKPGQGSGASQGGANYYTPQQMQSMNYGPF